MRVADESDASGHDAAPLDMLAALFDARGWACAAPNGPAGIWSGPAC